MLPAPLSDDLGAIITSAPARFNEILPLGARRLIIPPVPRRVHCPHVSPGSITLDPRQSHHLRDVLRLAAGEEVELFDDAGNIARGVVREVGDAVVVDVDQVHPAEAGSAMQLTIAAAVPKGERADWMVEKLSELGVGRFVPIVSERSVVVPQGKNKLQRWQRLATESAKQSRRGGVMRTDDVTPLAKLLAAIASGKDSQSAAADGTGASQAWYLSPAADATPIHRALAERRGAGELTLLIGPEGGWSEREIESFEQAGLLAVRLTGTILRIETAAIAAAAIIATSESMTRTR